MRKGTLLSSNVRKSRRNVRMNYLCTQVCCARLGSSKKLAVQEVGISVSYWKHADVEKEKQFIASYSIHKKALGCRDSGFDRPCLRSFTLSNYVFYFTFENIVYMNFTPNIKTLKYK